MLTAALTDTFYTFILTNQEIKNVFECTKEIYPFFPVVSKPQVCTGKAITVSAGAESSNMLLLLLAVLLPTEMLWAVTSMVLCPSRLFILISE